MPPRHTTYGKGLRGLSLASLITIAIALVLVFFYAPLDADQGFVQKIFYIHVPLAIVSLCGLIFGGGLAIGYLRTGDRRWDMRSYVAIHMALIFGVSGLITGSIWAKASWGHWWVWNEPTLVSFLIVLLLFATYQPLRFSIEDPERQSRYASVFAIVAGAFVPLNFIAVRLAQQYVHPRVLTLGGGNLPPSMRLHLPGVARRHRAAVPDPVEVRDGRQERALAGSAAAAHAARRRRGAPDRTERGAVVSALFAIAPALPLGKAGKFVAAAYIVFLALILTYVAIMAIRAQRLERELSDLRRDVELAREAARTRPPRDGQPRRSPPRERAAGGRSVVQDGAGRGSRAARVARGRARNSCAISAVPPRSTRPSRSRPATAPSSTWWSATRWKPSRRCWRCSRARPGIGPTGLAGAIYSHRNCDAARHLYRVVSGLESMIIGEAEIQGQVKRAYEAALSAETTGPLTNRLFTAALATGKRVRSETAIGELRLSLPGVGVALARERLGDLDGRRAVVIGTGETSELAARALADGGAHPVFVANRRRDRALGLARRYGGTSVNLDELPEAIVGADMVVSATASPHLLLEVREMADVMARAREPRAAAARPRGAARHRRRVRGASRASRSTTSTTSRPWPAATARSARCTPAARRASSRRRSSISRPGSGRSRCLPTLAALRTHATEIADQVVDENHGKWESASPRDLERIDAIARAVVNRLLHEPTLRMKEMTDDRVHARMALVRDLFALTGPTTV